MGERWKGGGEIGGEEGGEGDGEDVGLGFLYLLDFWELGGDGCWLTWYGGEDCSRREGWEGGDEMVYLWI